MLNNYKYGSPTLGTRGCFLVAFVFANLKFCEATDKDVQMINTDKCRSINPLVSRILHCIEYGDHVIFVVSWLAISQHTCENYIIIFQREHKTNQSRTIVGPHNYFDSVYRVDTASSVD